MILTAPHIAVSTKSDAVSFIGHRRYVKDGHWAREAGLLLGKR